MFFQQLAELSPTLDATFTIVQKDGVTSVTVLPKSAEAIVPLLVKGTPAELDEGFIDTIRRPMEIVNGLTTNAKEFEASVVKSSEAKSTEKKPASGAPSNPAKSSAKKSPDKKSTGTGKTTPAAAAPAVQEEAPAETQEQVSGTEKQVSPFDTGDKVTVTGPGKRRGDTGTVAANEVSPDGEIAIEFADGQELIAIKDLTLVKEEAATVVKIPFHKCRVCGCTQEDCSQCIEKTGEPCYWVEEDLCSRCKDEMDAQRNPAPAKPAPPRPTPPKPGRPLQEAADTGLFPNDAGGTGHGDISFSDADTGL